MIVSRARLAVDGASGTPRVISSSTVPQRWATTRVARDGWVEAVHQALGDGVFADDQHRTAIEARGAALLVRGLTATPLRRGRGATLTRLRARSGATILHLPGALLPQVGSEHTNALHIDLDSASRVLAASVVVPGRTAMGERGQFRRLRMRMVAHINGHLAFAEDATFEPQRSPIDSAAIFDGGGASVSLLALGDWPLADPAWWQAFLPAYVQGAASPLRLGGVCVRLLTSTLGDALAVIDMLEVAARTAGGDSPAEPVPAVVPPLPVAQAIPSIREPSAVDASTCGRGGHDDMDDARTESSVGAAAAGGARLGGGVFCTDGP